jgi:hypothetical protein
VYKYFDYTYYSIFLIPYLLSTSIMVILTWSAMTYILIFDGRTAMKEYQPKFMNSPYLPLKQRAKWIRFFTLIFWLVVFIVLLTVCIFKVIHYI